MTALVSDSEMAAIRQTAESGMVTTVVIKRRTLIENDYGSQESYATVATVQGWMTELTPTGASIGEVGGVQALAGVYRLFVPVGTDVQPEDQVLIGGLTFMVQHSDEGGTYLPFLTVIMRRPD